MRTSRSQGKLFDDITMFVRGPKFSGMRYVIVNGTMVIRDGVLVRAALPGRPVRRLVTTQYTPDCVPD